MLYYSEFREDFQRILADRPEEYRIHREHDQVLSIVRLKTPGALAPAEKKWERFQISLWDKLKELEASKDWQQLLKVVDVEFRKYTKSI